MTTSNWLAQATTELTAANIGTARLDALVLLEDELGKDRAHILAHPEVELNPEQLQTLQGQITQRKAHQPLAYIRGKTEFYGREFIITPEVLEPRPESETMIELLKTLPPDARQTIVDVGTGSGALAITAALELVTVQAIATDIDPSCLVVARKNCEKHKTTVELIETNLIEGLKIPANTTLLANLPYVPNDYTINDAATMEPKLAIFGGVDGLDLFRELFKQARGQAHPPVAILTESLPFQHEALAKIAAESGYVQDTEDDFIQVFSLVEPRST